MTSMKNSIIFSALFVCQAVFSQSNSYNDAWKALNSNDRVSAQKYLDDAMLNDPSNRMDAYITDLYLKTVDGDEKDARDFTSFFYDKSPDPYPYVYALWFNDAVLGDYGKKNSDEELELMNRILKDSTAPGTLVASANYQAEFHYLFSAEFEKAKEYGEQIGNIRNWQFTGPFENLSESGYYKNYGPLEHPEPGAIFKSSTNADVTWFTPADEIQDGWNPVIFNFNKNVAVIYAQNFVSSAEEQKVICNVGCSGSVKVWINDELIIAESKERTTEMDAYQTWVTLKKGVNRVLVQLGYTDLDYPNFIVRFTDGKGRMVNNITGSSSYSPYPKSENNPDSKPTMIKNFAEEYFQNKITRQPDNLVNYLLLSDTYMRNSKLAEARDVLNKALTIAPDNSIIRLKFIDLLNKQNNTTLYKEELEKLKQADPDNRIVLQLNIKEDYNNEKYDECADKLKKYKSLYGEDMYTDGYDLMLLIKDNKYDDLIKLAEKIYEKYPTRKEVVAMMYKIKKEVDKNNKAALDVYEKFMKDNYNYDTYSDYANILIDDGEVKKGLAIKEKITAEFPYDPHGSYNISKYYYSAKDFSKAEDYIRKSLALSPYNENYWELLGDIMSEKNDTADALKDYNQSLAFDPDQYDLIGKIRKLTLKPEITDLFHETDIDKAIKDDDTSKAQNTDYGYYYILDEKNAVMYKNGATDDYSTLIVKITNDKGVENFKESTINYGNNESLLIEKAEVIKKNGTKIEGERNDNQIVFTNLEAGDVIVFKYRTQSYSHGRFARDFWDRYSFGGQIYSAITRYNLFLPAEQKVNYLLTNSNLKPTVKNVEDFKEYSWEMDHPQPLKDEPLMPMLVDVGTVLHISTINSWQEIANWYSDVVNNKAEQDFEIIDLYNKLFPDQNKNLTQFEQAKIIYNYIESNIKYSEVAFMQSAFVPQRPAATLTTRLGDCKDLSSLFVTLARMCGIKAQMVLVDTRDNGNNDLMLPSVDFNHCIVKAILDKRNYYIELTDDHLPFASIPNNLQGALALEVPEKPVNENIQLIHLRFDNRTRDFVKRKIEIIPDGENLEVKVHSVIYGALTSPVRDEYLNLDSEKIKQEMEKTVARSYQNNISVEQVKFYNLDKLDDSVVYDYSYKVKNEIAQIGDFNTFQMEYPDIIASLDNFTSDKRTYPVEYWNYENADGYETVVDVEAPKGQKFMDVPAPQVMSFESLKYSLKYILESPGKLRIIRSFYDARPQEIQPEKYQEFKSFFEKIVKAERNYIAFK
jgi:tetratricopeptide (TPR) repeat protein